MSTVDSLPQLLNGKPITEWYTYHDENGTSLFHVARVESYENGKKQKDFPVWAKGSWGLTKKKIRKVLYRLPEVLKASPVFIVEGEKDVHTLEKLGFTATTNLGGAEKWDDSYSECLAGKTVIILPDNDEKGKRHSLQVAISLRGKAASTKILELPELPEKGDVSDWVREKSPDVAKEDLRNLWKCSPEFDPATCEISELSEESPDSAKSDSPFLASFASSEQPWPTIEPEAFYGLSGEIVQAIEPHSEADPVGLLVQFLVGFGNLIGRYAYNKVEADRHFCNEFAILVGSTSKGRKGTSLGHIRNLLGQVDSVWQQDRIDSGLSSGEGFIWSVRDPIEKTVPVREKNRFTGSYETFIEDQGVTDKRLLFIESEFASTLRVLGREGNTLSAVIRNAWDTGNLRIRTKNSPAQATDAHVSIIGHATKDELLRYLNDTEAGNGFGNRFLWVCVQRSKCLSNGGDIESVDFAPMILRIKEAVSLAKRTTAMTKDAEALELWAQVYPELSEGKPGLMGAMIARAEAHVLRLSAIYALLNLSSVIKKEHLKAALALWNYCEASARFTFGSSLGDPLVDELLSVLRRNPDGMTRTNIIDHFRRHKNKEQIDRVLNVLSRYRLLRVIREETEGRSADRFLATVTPAKEARKAKELRDIVPDRVQEAQAGTEEKSEIEELFL